MTSLDFSHDRVSAVAGAALRGKRVAHRLYAHVELLPELPSEEHKRILEAVRIAGLAAGQHFHVVRLDFEHDEVALLDYPTFFDDPFPSLKSSWRVHLPTKAIRFRDFSRSLNPPVLHRKELMLPDGHPEQPRFRSLTRMAEAIGLFDDPVRIGFREQWLELVASKGYSIVGHELVPIGNAEAHPLNRPAEPSATRAIQRHLTALSRSFLSAPVQALIRHGLLTERQTFFDYGCGKGDDIANVRSLGISASGWDPYFRPDVELHAAAVVNLGFVLNVIEDIDERIDALKRAYALTAGVISIATMLWSSTSTRGRPCGDGFITSRNTFQKYYNQSELQTFIESVLDEQALPVGPGIFFVFKDRHLEQRWLSRQVDTTRSIRLIGSHAGQTRALQLGRGTRTGKESDPAEAAAANKLWRFSLDFGRIPDAEEYPDAAEVTRIFGTWRRAIRAALQDADTNLLKEAAEQRAGELRAFFAMQTFHRRRPLRHLEPGLQKDIRAFFGSLRCAEAEGRRLLYQCADTEVIKQACESAATKGIGWLEADHSLQVHTSLVAQLDPVLRVYVGCATALYGDVLSADLIKIHIRSGKVTLMRFDDFFGRPLPRLLQRVKVKLREQDLDYFEYGGSFKPPLLFMKSRFMNEELPNYAEQLEFDRQLQALGIDFTDGYGPDADEFDRWLRSRRIEISGMRLAPSTQLPNLDGPCGKYLTFRQLCECGETWERTRVANEPQLASTYNALFDLATNVLDPVIEYFGGIKLTYGFASPALTRHISGRIAPNLDQHASCELNSNRRPICARGGAAIDFLVEHENMLEVLKWIVENCDFDRMYYYGPARPIHVSYAPALAREVFELPISGGRRIPRRMNLSTRS